MLHAPAGGHRRVLFLTSHLPYPPNSGGRRREYELLCRLGSELDVELYAVCKQREDWDHADALAEHCSEVRLFEAEPCERGSLANLDRVRMHRSRKAGEAIATRLAGDPMLVHAEGSYLVQHLPARLDSPLVVAEQNVESSLWDQRLAASANGDRPRLRRWAQRARAEELAGWMGADALVAVCQADAAEIAKRSGRRVDVVPDGCDHLAPASGPADLASDPATVSLIANFGYDPNRDAARLLLDEVWPAVLERCPGAELRLVGNSPPAWLRGRSGSNRVTVTGPVESVEPERNRATVIVAPHRVGGGVKVQVLEALTRGKALVATDVALQGLPAAARDALRSCARTSDLADAICAAIGDPAKRERLEAASREAAAHLPTWDEAAEALLGVYAGIRQDASRPMSSTARAGL